MNRGGSYPLFLPLSLSSSPTVSQAVGPPGCQRGNKVTGWWARHRLSDHMDWCCARHHSQWLTQQGSSHNRGTYSRPGFFFFIRFLSSFPPLPVPVYFNLSNLLLPLCSSIWPPLFTLFLCICSLLLPALFKCYGGERHTSAVIPLSPSHPRLLLIVLRARRWASCGVQNYCDTQSSVLSLWGISIFEEAKCERRQVLLTYTHRLASVQWQQAHKHTERRSSACIVLQTYSPFVACWHSLPHAAPTDLIYTESNPLVCLRNNYIFVVWIGWLPLRFVTPSCRRLCINQCLGGLEREQLYLLCFLASSTSCTRGGKGIRYTPLEGKGFFFFHSRTEMAVLLIGID